MNYKASFHTDIKITNSVKLKILMNDKIVSTGYVSTIKNRPLNTARKMNKGDTLVIKLLSYTNACKNPNKPYLIVSKVENVSKFKMSSPDMNAHRDILLPLVNNPNTKTYNNKRHEWFDIWNKDTVVFGIKVMDWKESDIYTLNTLKHLNEDGMLYKVGHFKSISSTYQKIL